MSPGPLSDLRVLDLSRLIPGPYCTLILSDLGARVDKLEDPHAGDYLRVMNLGGSGPNGLSGRFIALNRDKRSLCLDLKRPEGREALLRLVERYDVVVETFRPGVLDRLGVGYAALSARNPRLVLCSISGYGQTGPYSRKAGHDINYISIGGVLGMTGATASPAGNPVLPGVQVADIAGGALWGAGGILAALLEARQTGKGAQVDVSMCEGALSFMLPDLGQLAATGHEPARGGEILNGGAACYGVYATSDGRYLSVGALEPKFWLAFNGAIGRACDLSELFAGPEEQAQVRSEIAATLGTRTRDQWEAVFAGMDVCVEPVLGPAELEQHAQHAARGMFFRIGEYQQMRTPVMPLAAVNAEHLPPPMMGQHSAAILAEAGFAAEEIAALLRAGVTR